MASWLFAVTSVTPLSGTVVTTYTFDAANRLTNRQVSDGRSYTYTWSLRGELEAEWTQGVAVRSFGYDAAGRLSSLVHYGADHAGDSARLGISVSKEPEQDEIRLCLTVQASDLPDSVAEAVLDPTRAPDDLACVCLENAARIVRAHGGSLYARLTGPDSWTTLVLLPALVED